ncbi:phosphotransferase [Rhizobium sp. R693]|uniref:phosphotransferase n=1 Tax=Rhizobium sp. R693 TaxID=1764276 RepID=UPI000B530A65|nr:phosphotransferase [Rhizobium sp. R693]OWV98711.1 homoserine kinase [Rhizobium sp. R693]
MAVFTELSDEDRESIATAYGFRSLSSVIGIQNGDTETTYLFRTGDGDFIVTLFENGAVPLDLERAFATMDTLYNCGVPCPKPRRTVEGHATFQAAGRLIAIVDFLPGCPTENATIHKCENLGRVVAQIHSCLERKTDRSRSELPIGSVHGALSKDNVFFLNDTVGGVINFRLRHDDVLAAELADVLVGWTLEECGKLNEDKVRSVLKGYNSVRGLTVAESDALPGFVLAAAAKYFAGRKAGDSLPQLALAVYDSMLAAILN